jgi:hypothetical protein
MSMPAGGLHICSLCSPAAPAASTASPAGNSSDPLSVRRMPVCLICCKHGNLAAPPCLLW